MDVLKPELIWIDGRCYRVNPTVDSVIGDNEQFVEEEFGEENSKCPMEEPCEDYEIETTDSGRYRISFHIPRFYFSYVIGPKGRVRQRLENETKTQIRVPRQGQDGNIVITGNSMSGVAAARRRIDLIVASARSKQQFTHFISLPMNGEDIKSRFLSFKENVLEVCGNSRGVDPSIFQTPEKLHLTIGTLVLMDKDEREKARVALENCKESVIESLLQGKSLELTMTGIEYMNDDPAEVDVLYGRVQTKDGSNILQAVANSTVDYFVSKGLMQKQYDEVKLHVTLMNTLFRNDETSEGESSNRRQRTRETFDATEILKNFQNFYFGDHTVNTIHLSLRHSRAPCGYYQSTAEISLIPNKP